MTKRGGDKLSYDTFIEVQWVDAASNEAWSDASDDMSPPTMITRGWLIKETETYIVLANSLHKDTKDFGGSNSIPKGMVTSIRKLKVSDFVQRKRVVSSKQNGAKTSHKENTQSVL